MTDQRVADAVSKLLIMPLREELRQRDQKISELEKQVTTLENRVVSLEDELDNQEQYSRRNNLRIWSDSLEENAAENTDQIVLNHANKLGVVIAASDIDRSHRVGRRTPGKPRPIIVKMSSYRARCDLYSARKRVKDVFISEDLTKARTQLLYAARKAKADGYIKQTWTTDGKVKVRLQDDTVILVKNLHNLQTVLNK